MSKTNLEVNGPVGPENQIAALEKLPRKGPIGPQDQEEVVENPTDADQKSQQSA